jgi:hypothetical protein
MEGPFDSRRTPAFTSFAAARREKQAEPPSSVFVVFPFSTVQLRSIPRRCNCADASESPRECSPASLVDVAWILGVPRTHSPPAASSFGLQSGGAFKAAWNPSLPQDVSRRRSDSLKSLGWRRNGLSADCLALAPRCSRSFLLLPLRHLLPEAASQTLPAYATAGDNCWPSRNATEKIQPLCPLRVSNLAAGRVPTLP